MEVTACVGARAGREPDRERCRQHPSVVVVGMKTHPDDRRPIGHTPPLRQRDRLARPRGGAQQRQRVSLDRPGQAILEAVTDDRGCGRLGRYELRRSKQRRGVTIAADCHAPIVPRSTQPDLGGLIFDPPVSWL